MIATGLLARFLIRCATARKIEGKPRVTTNRTSLLVVSGGPTSAELFSEHHPPTGVEGESQYRLQQTRRPVYVSFEGGVGSWRHLDDWTPIPPQPDLNTAGACLVAKASTPATPG